MDEYCNHWFKRYILVERKNHFCYLVDNKLEFSTETREHLEKVLKLKLDTQYKAENDLSFLLINEGFIFIESDYPITKQSHPELFI